MRVFFIHRCSRDLGFLFFASDWINWLFKIAKSDQVMSHDREP